MRSHLGAGTVAAELRKATATLDPKLPVASVETMSDRLSESVSGPRFTTILVSAFAGMAIVLGLIGVYGVMEYRAQWQARELALRQVLGAQRWNIIAHVFRQGLAIILSGVCAGLLGAVGLSRLLSSWLYQVSVRDPVTFTVAPLALISVGLLACLVPAMRAAGSDPIRLLRHE
jgi:ABC-type antimicrobial peptide transport system permease subunit